MRLIFMGTPVAAVPTLQRCLTDGHDVVAVWTQPDKPAGRSKNLTQPAVKQFALAQGLPVYQPAKIRSQEALDAFASHHADAAVVVAYGRILPTGFLQAPRFGCINVHFSLLPQYRGAAPVNWAIVRGERETGVSTMMIVEKLDSGPILLQEQIAIGESETAPELMSRLSIIGADLLGKTLLEFDEIEPLTQSDEKATFAPMLHREDGLVDWALDATQIERRVRGFQPWPNAYTTYHSQRLIMWRASVATGESGQASEGEIIKTHGDELLVASGQNTLLRLEEVQLGGKRRMTARDFLNGARVRVGERMG